jgi:hypothetical protein
MTLVSSLLVLALAIIAIVLSITAICLMIYFSRAIHEKATDISVTSKLLGITAERLEKVADRHLINVFQILKEIVNYKSQLSGKESKEPAATPSREDIETTVKEIVERPGITTLRDLCFILKGRFNEQQIKDSVFRLRANGVITWDGGETGLDFTTPISPT